MSRRQSRGEGPHAEPLDIVNGAPVGAVARARVQVTKVQRPAEQAANTFGETAAGSSQHRLCIGDANQPGAQQIPRRRQDANTIM